MTLREDPTAETSAPLEDATEAPPVLAERALEVARAILGRGARDGRFELELVRADEAWSHVHERARYQARFRLFELAGVARVDLACTAGGATPRIRFPAPSEGSLDEGGEPALEDELERALALAADAARKEGRAGELRARVVSSRATRTASGRRATVLVRVHEEAKEGGVTVDLDARTGERLGADAPVLLRGSRAGRPTSADEARARVEAEEPVHPDARLVDARLEDVPGGRAWHLRWEVAGESDHGHVLVVAHARTGVVARIVSTVRPRIVLGPRAARRRAEALVAEALPQILGEGARLVVLVPGALVRGRRVRSGWVGTATTAEGDVARVSFADDEVEVALGRRSFRTRIAIP